MPTKEELQTALQRLGVPYIFKLWTSASDEWTVEVPYRGESYSTPQRSETDALQDVLEQIERARAKDDTRPSEAYR